MDIDTACNFPELLALDLESAESVFASKRMTAGAPRPMEVIFESKSIQDLVEAKVLSTEDAVVYSSARNFLSPEAFAQLQAQADAMARLTRRKIQIQSHSRSHSTSNAALSPSEKDTLLLHQRPSTSAGDGGLGGISVIPRSKQTSAVPLFSPTASCHNTTEWDTDSVDSFEVPNINLSRRRDSVPQQQDQREQEQEGEEAQDNYLDQQQHQQPKKEPSFDETNHHLFLQSEHYGGGSSFRDSRDSYGSLYDSYDYTDDLDDSASVSSYGLSAPTASRGRQQSVATAATSVSSNCRFSSQSRRLSAMGPSSPTQRESMAACDRHVEFNLDTDTINDFVKAEDPSSSKHSNSNRSSRHIQKSNIKAASEPTQTTEGTNKQLTVVEKSAHSKVAGSSWMSFDDDDDDDDDDDPAQSGSTTLSVDDTALNSYSRSNVNGHSFYHESLPPRPRTSMGVSGKETPPFSELANWTFNKKHMSQISVTSATPATPVPVPRRRSSLKHQTAQEDEDKSDVPFQKYGKYGQQQKQQGQQEPRPLRHFRTFSDALTPYGGDARALQSEQLKSETGHSRATERSISLTNAASSYFAPSDATDTEESPIILQRTVYRKPIADPPRLSAAPAAKSAAKAARGLEQRMQGMAQPKTDTLTKGQPVMRQREVLQVSNNGHNSPAHLNAHSLSHSLSSQKMYAEPLLISQFDDDSDSECNENASENDTNLFGGFEGAYNCDEADDKIMLATMMPVSRQLPHSLRSLKSRQSLMSLPEDSTRISSRHHVHDILNEEETSRSLQSWIEQASQSQLELAVQKPEYAYNNEQSRSCEKGAFYEEDEPEAEHQENEPALHSTSKGQEQLQESSQQSQPIPVFYQPGIVGIPLPREVVETLRVSVSCFPETMLSLSSFSIQTIRSYSRKVRRCSQSDADSAHQWLMSGLPPSPASMAPFVPSMLPPSPTTSSFYDSPAFDLGTGVSRTTTGSTSGSYSSRRFWKLPKKLVQSRTNPSLSMFHSSRSSGSSYATSTTAAATPRRGSRTDDQHASLADDEQGKDSGLCFKRIFPTGSDYLCDALYAHIIAFNYISLLCPPPAAAAESGTASAKRPAADGQQRPVTPSSTMSTSTATLFESSAHQLKRQTIRIYVGSDVPLPTLSHFVSTESMPQERANPASVSKLENTNMLLSPSSTPPPSRGRGDDDNRMISRKAALLLGISETLEPDNHKPVAPPSSVSTGSNSLVRRYNTMRRRGLKIANSISEAANAAEPHASKSAHASKMMKKAMSSSKLSVDNSSIRGSEAALHGSETAAKATVTELAFADPAGSAATAATTHNNNATAASDASMRDLHAGLYACISQLVATMKLTTGQLGNTLLNAEMSRDIDPLFLRTLCELVRSQEEQF